MLPTSAERVPENTSEKINRRIREQTEANIERYAAAGKKHIDARLIELDEEWDIERAIETNAAGLAVLGIILSTISSKRWLFLSAFVGGFLFQHGLQGWCPPVPALRRLGFRTRDEINYEKYSLKYIRGDFDEPPKNEGKKSGNKERQNNRRKTAKSTKS